MANEDIYTFSEAFPMKGGDGIHSYTLNSNLQGNGVIAAKKLITESIAEKLDIKIFSSLNICRIADLGCSVGPNTFFAVQNIVDAVKFKYKNLGLDSQIPEFHAFFNDHVANDFNTLFTSLPPNREYHAAGVPGSFYSKLFPNSLLHIVNCSFSCHWLSKVPKEVIDKSSSAWNKGRIHYANAPDAVVKAFEAQYQKDMDSFLCLRAQEIVHGGLLVIFSPSRPSGTSHSQSAYNMLVDALSPCLMDLVKKGVVDEKKVDSFNIPVFHFSPEELTQAVDRTGYFSIEEIKELPLTANGTLSLEQLSLHIRAIVELSVKANFGEEILDELFDLYLKKLQELSFNFNSENSINVFAILKRK
ncbi:S-adenosylmethionine-dependent methyltransferase [Quillaja saponaria]|uniref:S-adenosylmethionine-dependent methyltransferase n=1 Tax=Quillaja saponaria TaxID=32244 RepID=A0AAD7VH20_QUISA|nr:S-adenosylmethionine-dependent methyltransferase [Quillaja saponaria]